MGILRRANPCQETTQGQGFKPGPWREIHTGLVCNMYTWNRTPFDSVAALKLASLRTSEIQVFN